MSPMSVIRRIRIIILGFFLVSGCLPVRATPNLFFTPTIENLQPANTLAPHTPYMLSTPDLINQALADGKISSEQRLLYLAYAVYEYESLPEAYQSTVRWDGTFVVRELRRAADSSQTICQMSPEIRREFQRLVKSAITCPDK